MAPGRARACELRLTGEPSAAWREAVQELSHDEASRGDCAQLQLDVRGNAAQLTFVTRDGRRAERTPGSADELAPALAALHVVDPEADAAPAQEPAQSSARSTSAGSAHEQRRFFPRFTLLTGVRAGEDAMLTPMLHTSVLLKLRQRWELGVFGAWETRYVKLRGRDELTAREDALRLGAGRVGAAFAHCRQLKSVALLGGARLAYDLQYARSEQIPTPLADTTLPLLGLYFPTRRNYARAGLFAGMSFPARGTLARLRVELGADFRFPWESARMKVSNWGFGALVGLELGRP